MLQHFKSVYYRAKQFKFTTKQSPHFFRNEGFCIGQLREIEVLQENPGNNLLFALVESYLESEAHKLRRDSLQKTIRICEKAIICICQINLLFVLLTIQSANNSISFSSFVFKRNIGNGKCNGNVVVGYFRVLLNVLCDSLISFFHIVAYSLHDVFGISDVFNLFSNFFRINHNLPPKCRFWFLSYI